ncbi:MAG: hypothetical protein ACKODK_10870 [Opitutaceae bacterium]
MNPPYRMRDPARWPFWALLAAWFCANTPAVAVCAVLAWLGEARHFSHQQRLMTDVACLLTGNETPGLGVMAAVKDMTPVQPSPPPLGGLEVKKIDLAVEGSVEVPTVTRETRILIRPVVWSQSWREAPPHEPPRESAAG